MSGEMVKVENEAAIAALGRFGVNLQQRAELTKVIAAGQLVSVRRTFREQGSPADSWAPLSPRTIADGKNKATVGRKILILSGRLLNSIHGESDNDSATVGTNLIYARVQNDGSADHAESAAGPQARIAGRSVEVGDHLRFMTNHLGHGKQETVDKNGRKRNVVKAIQGPRTLRKTVKVSRHNRFQNIRARRFMILRPEDPARIEAQVISFTARAAQQAGLSTGGA